MSDSHLHKIAYFKNPKLDMSLTPALADTFAMAAKAGRAYLSTVMLLGETGVGKTSIARHIHDSSTRSQKPFQVINLSQATPSIFESEFFGHEKGSFTGAHQLKKSPFELADGGTVFLDEIGTLSFELQARLLRLVEERTFKRVGGIDDITVDVRILVATSLNLEEKVRNGEFREDLYHRLNVLQIYVPPLRDRQADIIPLAEYFLTQASVSDRLSKKTLSDESKKALQAHGWTGNVRTLENEMKRATILTDGDVIELSDLSFHQKEKNAHSLVATHILRAENKEDEKFCEAIKSLSHFTTFKEIEAVCDEAKRYIFSIVLPKNGFSKMRSAEDMHANPTTMASRFVSLFRSENGNAPAMRSALETWEKEKLSNPDAILAEDVAKEVLAVNLLSDSTEVIDDISDCAKKERIKMTFVDCDHNRTKTAAALGVDVNTLGHFFRKHSDLKLWLHQEESRSSEIPMLLGRSP